MQHSVITHSGGFHPDDVFAVAAFQLLLGPDNVNVIRTRDESVMQSGDYVVDVGGEYDHDRQRYDHHQPGAPVRENGIPYAGFGLMWKHYGTRICNSEDVARAIDEKLCQPIDAGDNGVALYELNGYGVRPFELYNVIGSYKPLSKDDDALRAGFDAAVTFAQQLLQRTIAHTTEMTRMAAYVQDVYEQADDKSVLVFPEPVERHLLIPYPDVLAIVYPSEDPARGRTWKVETVPTGEGAFLVRAILPGAWAGLRDAELQEVSGIADALFCHKGRWLCVTTSEESAIAAARTVQPE